MIRIEIEIDDVEIVNNEALKSYLIGKALHGLADEIIATGKMASRPIFSLDGDAVGKLDVVE